MPLTPIDIQQKTFGPELRGYNMDEVDDFLDEVVAALKDYDQRVRDAQDRIRALEAELSTRGEDESAISRALVAAQKQADSIVADARTEAAKIEVEAHDEAERLRAEREAERVGLTQDIARMRSTVADLRRRVGELAVSVGADLDEMDTVASRASEDIAGVGGSSGGAGSADDYEEAEVGEGLAPFGSDSESGPGVAEAEEGEPEVEQAPVSEFVDVDEIAVDEIVGEGEGDLADEDDGVPPASGHGQHLSTDPGEGAGEGGEEVEESDKMVDAAEEDEDFEDDQPSSPAARRPWERGSV